MIVDITERKRTQDRLLMLESSVENANDAILVTKAEPLDAPGPQIIYANRAFTRTTGYTEADVLGKNPRMSQGPNTDPAATKKIRQALERWESVRVEILNSRKDGSEFWVELNIVPVANERGWYTHWVSVQREITERKAAQVVLEQARDEDRQRLSQVVLNLLSNAVKYNWAGGTVSVFCDVAVTMSRLRLSVNDTGPGIAPGDLDKLFVPFERLGAERSGVEGTGIGLALAKRLVEAMGGAIGVESVPGRGSTFFVELPARDVLSSEANDSSGSELAGATASGPTVLYIEDNPSNYALVEQVLELQRPTIRLLGATGAP